MRKTFLLAAGLVLALTWAKPAAADTVVFDPDGLGPGGNIFADLFDWAPGNSMIIEDSATKGRVLFQANLANIVIPGTDFANGANGFFFTAVAGFAVDIASTAGGSTLTLDDTSSFNFFKIYATSAPATLDGANDLTGAGFTNGIVILEAHALKDGTSSSTTINNPNAGKLDNFGGNDYPGINSFAITGSTDLRLLVDNANPFWFKNLINGTTLGFHGTQVLDPYSHANPSAFFTNNGTTAANEMGVDPTGVAGVGILNGACVGPDGIDAGTDPDPLALCKIVAESDASTTFIGTSSVPEPATMTLLGLGLLGSAAARRRQLKAKKVA